MVNSTQMFLKSSLDGRGNPVEKQLGHSRKGALKESNKILWLLVRRGI